jgi:hypothetical protein
METLGLVLAVIGMVLMLMGLTVAMGVLALYALIKYMEK